jgi:hypothetical protein
VSTAFTLSFHGNLFYGDTSCVSTS